MSIMPIWIYGSSPAPTYADLEYANVGGVSLRLDIYLPDGIVGPSPVVVFIHGGGWVGGDKADPRGCAGLLQQGIAVASINYRLSQQATFPAQIYDCKAAIRYLRAHAAQYDLDTDRFGVWGSSAGGHLAALVGTSASVAELEGDEGNLGYSSRLQAAVDYWGPTDFLVESSQITDPPGCTRDPDADTSIESRLIGKGIGDIRAHINEPSYQPWVTLVGQANPITWVTHDDPPFLIRHGDADTTIPLGQSRILHEALQQAGLLSTFDVLIGGTHGTTNISEVPTYEFFRTVFGLPVPITRAGSLKTSYDKVRAELRGVVVTAVFGTYLYVEDTDRSAGIRVPGSFSGISEGDAVDVSGTVTTVTRNSQPSERQLSFATVTRVEAGDPIEPLVMQCKDIGGAGVAPNLPGVIGGAGLNNIGLLVAVFGKVTSKYGNNVFVDDGSGVVDPNGIPGIMVQLPAPAEPNVGDMVSATGVVVGNVYTGTTTNRRCIQARSDSDLKLLWSKPPS